MLRSLRWLAALTLLVGVIAMTGCASPEPGPEGGSETPTPTPETSEQVVAPGIYDVEGGKVQAVGTLDYRDLEGGFWAVVDTPIPAEAAEADVVAVIANAEDVDVDLEALRGEYVSATGTRLEGASIRQAGPEIEAERIEAVSDMVVVPGY